jgi:glycine zipper 2TM protein
MTIRFKCYIAAALVPFLVLISCATPPPPGTALTSEQRSQVQKDCIAQYTAMGTIGGALLGALLSSGSNRGRGAVIGAAAGGALSFAVAWGHCLQQYSDLTSYPVANAQQTAEQVGYNASRGNEIKIQNFSVNPNSLAPGNEMNFNGSYYVMAPEGQKEVKVTETRAVHYFDPAENAWKELGSVDGQITSALGTRRADGHFDIPKDVPEGRYRVTLKVAALGKQDQASQEIVVKKA